MYAQKCENLGEIDKCLEKYNLPQLNKEEEESLNRPITASETEAVIKKTANTQKPWTGWFHRGVLNST